MGRNPFSSTATPPPPPSALPPPSTPPTQQQAPEISVANAVSSSVAPSNQTAPGTARVPPQANSPNLAVTPQKSVDEQYRDFKGLMSLALIGLCPLLMLLPPRRFNAITALQGGMLGWGVNEQTSYRTGHDLIWHYNRWVTNDRK